MKKFIGSLIQTLLEISENQSDFTKWIGFKCGKIILYQFQLFGYLYSQYEIKPLTTPELNYLAQYTQLSPGTFALLQYGHNTLTKFMFYIIVNLHLSVYIAILYLSITRTQSKFLFTVLNFFFVNYDFMLMTPLQEISIGMMVCGPNAFLSYNISSMDCGANQPPQLYFFGSLGCALVTLSAFVQVYFFRNYQFYDNNFLRQYSLMAFIRLFLHQVIEISYYLFLPLLNYIKHILAHILIINISLNSVRKFPFGFTLEAKFFTAVFSAAEWFMLLLSIWLFSEVDASFIFLTFLVLSPAIMAFSLNLLERQRIKLILEFDPDQFNPNSDVYLEEIYRNATSFYEVIQSKLIFMQIMQVHVAKCCQIDCPCLKKTAGFLDSGNNIDWQVLNNFTAFTFELILKATLKQGQIEEYEQFALKYVTFLQRFKNNPVLSFGILQDIQNNQFIANKSIRVNFKSSFYFSYIVEIIQQRNIQSIQDYYQTTHKQITNNEGIFFKDVSQIFDLGDYLQAQIQALLAFQIKFWQLYISQSILDYDELRKLLIQMYNLRQRCKEVHFECFQDDKTISPLRIRLQIIYNICCDKDFQQIIKLEKLLISQTVNDSVDNISWFKAQYLFSNKVLSLIVSCSPQNNGKIKLDIDQFFLDFFKYDKADPRLKQIDNLMPEYFKEFHDKLIANYLNNGHSQYINGYLRTFILNGQGFIDPVIISFNNYFPTQNKNDNFEFYMITHIRKISRHNTDFTNLIEVNNQGYILLDSNFRIIGLTDSIYACVSSYLINLTDPQLVMKHSNIFKMIPNLEKEVEEFYQNLYLLQQDLQNIDMFTCNDFLNLSYDEDLGLLNRQKKQKMLSAKERLKSLKSIRKSLTSESTQQGIPIQYTMVQRIIKYSHQGQEVKRLYYEISIQIKSQQDDQHQLFNKLQTIKSIHQIRQENDSNRLMSVENAEKSDVQLVSMMEEDLNFNDGSRSSMFSIQSSIKTIKEFQQFLQWGELPRVFNQFAQVNLAFIAFYLIILLIILIIVQNYGSKYECLKDYQRSFEVYRYYSQLVQNEIICEYIDNENNKIINNSSQLEIIQQQLINQSHIICLDINQQLIIQWFKYKSQQLSFDSYYQKQINLTKVVKIDQNLIVQQTKEQLETFFTGINTYLYLEQQDNLIRLIRYDSFLIPNYYQYNQILLETQNRCQTIDSSQYVMALNIIQYLAYVLVIVMLLGMHLQNNKITYKTSLILGVYSQIEYFHVYKELKSQDILSKYLRYSSPWMKNMVFDSILVESMNYMEYHPQSIQESKTQTKQSVDIPQMKLYRLPPIKERVSKFHQIAFYLLVGVILIVYQIVIQIQNNSEQQFLNQLDTEFNQILYFRQNLLDIITNWEYQGFYKWQNKNFTFYEVDKDYYDKLINQLRQSQFQDLIRTMGKAKLSENICNTQCEEFLDDWKLRLLQENYHYFDEGINNPIQSILNIMNQNNDFEVTEIPFFDQEFFALFFWGQDILQEQIKITLNNFIDNQYEAIQSQQSLNKILIIIFGIIIISLISILLIKRLLRQRRQFQQLKESLIFLPFLQQTKLSNSSLLKQLKN